MGRKQDRRVSSPFYSLTTDYTGDFDHPGTYIEEDHPADEESTVVSVGEHREFNDLLIAEERERKWICYNCDNRENYGRNPCSSCGKRSLLSSYRPQADLTEPRSNTPEYLLVT